MVALPHASHEPPRGRIELSVIIPMRNAADTILEQLDALAASETTIGWEVVVADNGSSDGCGRLVADRIATFPVPLRVVDAGSVIGAGAARNAAVRASVGDKLAFCDADDLVWPDWVQQAGDALETTSFCSGLTYVFTDTPSTHRLDGNPDGTFSNAAGPSVSGSNFAIRRALFFEVGGFDESLGAYGHEDSELAIRCGKAGHPAQQVRTMRVYRRETVNRGALLRKTWQKANAQYVLFQRHPDVYAHMLTHRNIFLEQLQALPHRWFDLLRTGRRPAVSDAARDAVTWAGLHRSQRAWERSTSDHEPRRVGPDPRARRSGQV